MREPNVIENDIEDLKGKIESLISETSQKKEKLEELRANNARLLAANAGSKRKPQSLSVQIERIRSAQIEIEQSEAASKILERQIEGLEEELHTSEIHGDLQANYFPQSTKYLEATEVIRQTIRELVRLTEKVTGEIKNLMLLPDPLNTLHATFSRINNRAQFDSLAFNWGEEQQKFRQFTEIMADEKKIENLPGILKTFSDVFLSIETGGPEMASKLRLISDAIPEKPTRKGPVPIGGGGAKMTRQPDEIPDIVRFPGKYDERDVKKFATEAANRA